MKKLFIFLAAGCLLGFNSCTAKKEGGLSATAQKNIDANRAIAKCFETNDFSKIGDYIAEDAVDHAGMNGETRGLAAIKADLEAMAAAMSDLKYEFLKELADDEYGMMWMRMTATLKSDMMGMKAGDKIDSRAIELCRFKDGKMVEHWTFMDPAEMMKMMGGGMPAQLPADSTTGPAQQ